MYMYTHIIIYMIVSDIICISQCLGLGNTSKHRRIETGDGLTSEHSPCLFAAEVHRNWHRQTKSPPEKRHLGQTDSIWEH